MTDIEKQVFEACEKFIEELHVITACSSKRDLRIKTRSLKLEVLAYKEYLKAGEEREHDNH